MATPLTPEPDVTWDIVNSRIGDAYDIKSMQASGRFTPKQVLDKVNSQIDEMQNIYGPVFDVRGAWQAGRSLGKIKNYLGSEPIQEKIKDKVYGVMQEPKPMGLMGKLGRLWRSTEPGSAGLEYGRGEQSDLGKLATLPLTTTMRGLRGLGLASESATQMGGQAARKLGEVVPSGGPKIVPVPTGFKGQFPFIEGEMVTPGEAVSAGAGLIGAEGLDPTNWITGPASKILKGAKRIKPVERFVSKYAPFALEASELAARNAADTAKKSLLRKLITPVEGQYYHQFDPRGVVDVASSLGQGLTALGKGAVSGVQKITGKPAPLGEAMTDVEKIISKQPTTIDQITPETRIRELSEIFGEDITKGAEIKLNEERAFKREQAKLRNKGFDQESINEIMALEREAKKPKVAPGESGIKTTSLTITLKKEADRLKQMANPEAQKIGNITGAIAEADETAKLIEATPDQIYGGKLAEESASLAAEAKGLPRTKMQKIKSIIAPFLADPSSTLPKIAHEFARVSDKMNSMVNMFENHWLGISSQLTKTEKYVLSIIKDVDPKVAGAVIARLKPLIPFDEVKVLQLLPEWKKNTDKFADMLGLKKEERVKAFVPRSGLTKKKYGLAAETDELTAQPIPAGSMLPRKSKDSLGELENIIKQYTKDGEVFDIDKIMSMYLRGAARKAYMNPAIKVWEPRIATLSPGAKAYAESLMNVALGHPTPMAQKVNNAVNNALEAVSSKLAKAFGDSAADKSSKFAIMNFYRGLLGLAVDTSFKNLFQIQNTLVEHGLIPTIMGYSKAIPATASYVASQVAGAAKMKFAKTFIDNHLSPRGRRIFEQAGILDELTRTLGGQFENLNKSGFKAAFDSVLFSPMRFSEYLNRSAAFYSALGEGMERGLRGPKIYEYAKDMVRKTQFQYGKVNTSPFFQNPLGKMVQQFGSYPLKEAEFINQVLKDPDKRKMYRFLAFHGFLLGGAMASGTRAYEAGGWVDAPLPWTEDDAGKRVSVPLPFGMLPHLDLYGAPIPQALAKTGLALATGFGQKQTKDAFEIWANSVPGRRYLEKLRGIQLKLREDSEKKPPTIVEQGMSIASGEGPKEYEPDSEGYTGYDALREALGVRPSTKTRRIFDIMTGRQE